MAVMEVILKAVDKITPTLNQVKSQTGNVTKFMNDNWLKVGAAASAVALGAETLYKKQAPLLEASRQLAASLDMTEGAVRDMAIEVSNVTFPLESVFNIMETGRQQGIKSAEELKKYATFWDTVGDATGENADALAASSSALRAVGIAAGEESEKLDKSFGYIMRETTGDIGEFIRFLEKCGPELREMGMSVEDTAGIMGALEHEMGMTAMVARMEFRQAVNEADGDMGKLYETLGLTEEQVKKYQDQVSESGGVIEEFARINNETMYTSLDKIKHAFGEVMLKMSPALKGVADFAPALLAVGPAMKGIGVAGNLMAGGLGKIVPMLSGIVSGFKALGGLLIANPWVIAIAAIVAAVILLYKNWDKVVSFFKTTWESISNIFTSLKENIGKALEGVWEAVQNIFGLILDYLVNFFSNLGSFIINPFGFIIEQLDNLFPGLKDSLVGFLESIGDFMSEKMGWIVEKVLGVWEGFTDKLKSVWSGVGEALKGFVNIFINALNWLIDRLNKFSIKIPDWVPKALGGGKTWGFNIPKIPTLHSGGVYRAPTPGGEGLALLRDREIVSTPEQMGASIVISQGAIVINTQRLDDREINRVGDKLMDVIISKSRAYNLRFGR